VKILIKFFQSIIKTNLRTQSRALLVINHQILPEIFHHYYRFKILQSYLKPQVLPFPTGLEEQWKRKKEEIKLKFLWKSKVYKLKASNFWETIFSSTDDSLLKKYLALDQKLQVFSLKHLQIPILKIWPCLWKNQVSWKEAETFNKFMAKLDIKRRFLVIKKCSLLVQFLIILLGFKNIYSQNPIIWIQINLKAYQISNNNKLIIWFSKYNLL
jgi:hypothetical protein